MSRNFVTAHLVHQYGSIMSISEQESGTNYKPLDNEHQIRESLEDMCRLINRKNNVFKKSLLALVLLSYIQAFNDGNKRTARIVSNAILIATVKNKILFLIDFLRVMFIGLIWY